MTSEPVLEMTQRESLFTSIHTRKHKQVLRVRTCRHVHPTTPEGKWLQLNQKLKEPHSEVLITFLTQPNFLVLFRTGNDNHPSNLDSVNKQYMNINTMILPNNEEFNKNLMWKSQANQICPLEFRP